MAKKDLGNGVAIDPMPPSVGKNVNIYYSGELTTHKSEPLSVHVMYGSPDRYFGSKTIEMSKQGQNFHASFQIEASDTLNFYFSDEKNHIDDNNGKPWQTAVDSDSLSYG